MKTEEIKQNSLIQKSVFMLIIMALWMCIAKYLGLTL